MFGKILGTFLYFRQNPLFGTIFIIICFLHIAFLPEPAYSGPDNVIYFRGSSLQDELERDKRVTWIVEFYAAWAPNCVNFASTFAELSGKFHLDNLKFGKMDASTYGEVAKKFGVSTSSFSKQLPTIILFQNGKEVARRPVVDNKGWVAKFIFNKENVVREFALNDVYHQCKQNPIKKKGTKQNLDAPKPGAKPKTE